MLWAALFALASLAWIATAGCGPSDPLETIRVQQDVDGDFASSLEPLRELLKTRAEDPEVQFRYGKALLMTGESGKAMWSLRRAMESPEWREEAGLPLAATLLLSGAHDDSIEICNLLLEKDPDDSDALLMRANARMHSRRDYEGSLADADRVLELDPEKREALVPRTVALLALQRVEEAAEALEDLEGIYRDDTLGLQGSPELCIAMATFALEKGEIEIAEERFEGCIESFEGHGLVLRAAMKFFDDLGRAERADELLSDALALVPESYSYRSTLAVRLLARGKPEEAEALLRAGTEIGTRETKTEAWAGVASFNVEQGDFDEAIEAFEKARALDGAKSPQLLLAHADALVLAHRPDDAQAVVEEIDLPGHRELLLGRIALERDEPDEALKHFAEGNLLWPNNAISRYYTAVAAERLGDFERAIEEYRYAMRIDTGATDAYLRLARLHEAAGDLPDALGAVRFKPGGRPEERDAALLHVRVLARMGRIKDMPKAVERFVRRPESWGAGIAAIGEGVRIRSGAQAALDAMRSAEGLDLENPSQVDALAAFVVDYAETGAAAKGLALAEAAVKKHPDAAAFHAVKGQALAASGAEPERVRAAYARALELDGDEVRARLGMAELDLAAGEPDAAWVHLEHVLAREPSQREAMRLAATALAKLGRSADAETQLRNLLGFYPYDASAAIALAELRMARGARDARTLELARRAVKFGGGEKAETLVATLSATS